jgi:hypothetical protein
MDTSPLTDPGADFGQALNKFGGAVEGLVDDVAAALGLADASNFSGAVAAWYIDPAEVLSIYAMSGGALTIYQRTREGQTLAVTVPVERVSRLVLGAGGEQSSLTIELDADQLTVEQQAEYVETPAHNGAETSGRMASRHVHKRAGYVLTADTDDKKADLKRLYRQLAFVAHGR